MIIKKNWFTESNRYKHFIGGAIIGLGADILYCAGYAVCYAVTSIL